MLLALTHSLVQRVHMQRMRTDADDAVADDIDDIDANDVDNAKFCDTCMILTLSFKYRRSKHIEGAIWQEPFVSSTKMVTRPPTLHLRPSATSTSWRALNIYGTMTSLRS